MIKGIWLQIKLSPPPPKKKGGVYQCRQLRITRHSKTVKDRVMEFSGMIDLSNGVADRGLNISAVTSGRHRKWKKKSKFSKLIFQIKTYTILSGLFSSVQNNWPHRKLKRQLPVISKTIFKFSIFNALNLPYN
jgi:hypothetical protein